MTDMKLQYERNIHPLSMESNGTFFNTSISHVSGDLVSLFRGLFDCRDDCLFHPAAGYGRKPFRIGPVKNRITS